MKIAVKIINAFVDNNQGGNPAGVVLNADSLSADDKLAIARQVGLSETAFVSGSAIADFKLDFFTPTRQIAHCGHATIAVFSYLSQAGLLKGLHSSKETIDGVRRIFLKDGLAYMEQQAPRYQPIAAAQVLRSLRLTNDTILPGAPIEIVNTGNSFAIAAVRDQQVLRAISPDFSLIESISEEHDLIGYYIWCPPAANTGDDGYTRMFAPRYGIPEEAATGMAAGPLACYLRDRMGILKKEWKIKQGWLMEIPSPSLLRVELEADRLMVGGKGVIMKEVSVIL